MKLAHPEWLFGAFVAVAVAVGLVAGGFLLLRAVRRFGDDGRMAELVTSPAGGRRAFKGVLLVLSVALGFVALAQPQYGRGTRLIPATNLDVVVVLDYSKSMYARDIAPSRIARAKAEIGQLVRELPGARFGAIAFAGEPIAFPLTSDGGAIAQFFRQLTPNDMPVGGTAIARALEAGRELLQRDPTARKHHKVILLVTDGEDLEGNPVSVAEAAKADAVTVHVVQIGGRTPEPIPHVDDTGEATGPRTDDSGRPITTSLTADGEAQLAKIAEVTGGVVVRAERGSTGLRDITDRLSRFMTEELSERVETVYADVYVYPLVAALVLLVVETFVPEGPTRPHPTRVAPPAPMRRPRKRRRMATTAAVGSALAALSAFAPGCERADALFTRNSPVVDQAIGSYDAGDASAAMRLLTGYLSTGECVDGTLGTPDDLLGKPNAVFDLGLALFEIGERFGRRFGEEQDDAGTGPEAEGRAAKRSAQVDCALKIVTRVAADGTVPIDLRARAHYLAGNLEFLRRQYRSAVASYDASIALVPGLPEDSGADGIGRDAAWNRAIALRRAEEEERRDAGTDRDVPPDSGGDAASNDAGGGDSGRPDSGPSEPDGGQDSGSDDSRPDAGGGGDSGRPDAAKNDSRPDGGQAPPRAQPPSTSQDERILDMLEAAPTVQQHNAKTRALQRRVRALEDK